jgi:hypothetical protein
MTKAYTLALETISHAIGYLHAWGYKTYDYFLRTLSASVRALWAGNISEAEFVDRLAGLLEQQMRRAWNEGMRENGLDPAKDMKDEWEQKYQDLVAEQFGYVDQFAADIVEARSKEGATVDQFIARAEMWANNYTSTVNTAIIVTGEKDAHYVWRLGATEEHCETCLGLNGIVALADDWAQLAAQGIEPQGDKLVCGGWNCDCRIELTDDDLTPGGIPDVETK